MADEEQQPPFIRRNGKEKVVEEVESSSSSSSSTTINQEITLSFDITPIKVFKKALKILKDIGLNPSSGQAMVKVTAQRRFLITAQNHDTGVAATVIFQGSDLHNFLCIRPFSRPHTINVHQFLLLLNLLNSGPYDHTISFFQYRSSLNELHFSLESALGRAQKVDLLPSEPSVAALMPHSLEPLSRAIYLCEVPIDDTTLHKIIQHLQTDAQQVSVEVKRKCATISTDGQSWDMACEDNTSEKKHYYALFELPHLESIRIASSKARGAVLGLSAIPRVHIMIRIFLEGVGEVEFRYKALKLRTVFGKDSPGGDTAEASQQRSDAFETSQPGGVAAEASQPGSDAAETSLPGDVATEALQFSSDADEALQSSGEAAEASQPVQVQHSEFK